MVEPEKGGSSTLDSWIALSYLAAKTKRIRLGTLVTPIPLRPPAILAKMVATLDVLSNGRVILGVGAGWSRSEFEGYSQWNNSRERVERTEEGVQLIMKLWTEGSVDFDGKYYRCNGAVLEPKTVQSPYPPLLFGALGAGQKMLKLAGRYADLCFIPVSRMKNFSFGEAKNIVLNEARLHSRDKSISFVGGANFSLDKFPYFGSKYDPKSYADGIVKAKESGCDYVLVPFPSERFLDDLRHFCKEILPSF